MSTALLPMQEGGTWVLPIDVPHLKSFCGEFVKNDHCQRVVVAVVAHPRSNAHRPSVMYFGWNFRSNGSSAAGHGGPMPRIVGWDFADEAHGIDELEGIGGRAMDDLQRLTAAVTETRRATQEAGR